MRAFFAYLYPQYDTLLSMDGDDIAASATLIPCKIIRPGQEDTDALYLYSLTTLPAFRGRGHAQRLLDAAKEKCSCVFLHAADDSLFSMYKARGWRGMMHVKEQLVPAQKHDIDIKPLHAHEYLHLREQHLADVPHVCWDENAMHFQAELLLFGNGGFYAYNHSIAAVLNWEDKHCLPIAEALGNDATMLCAALAHAYRHEKAGVLIPCTATDPGAFPYAQGVGEEIPDPIQLSFVYL